MTYIPSKDLDALPALARMDASTRVTVAAPWLPPLPHQWEHYKYLPAERIETSALLGGWGSGKTHGNVRKALRLAALNPWRSVYGEGNPRGILAAPTHRILRQSVMHHFDQLVPPEMILRRRGPPHNDILMSNGFLWILHSAESEIEGLDAAVVLATEIHHPSWASDPQKYLNLVARLRDPNARYMGMLVDGLPESGWVRDTFDTENRPNPNRNTILAATKQNPFIPKETLSSFYESCPSGQEKKLLGGQWMPPIGAIYPQFSADIHLVEERMIPHNVTTHVGMDVGNFGAVVFAQEIGVELQDITGRKSNGRGMLVGDQLLTNDESVDRMCYRIRTETPWAITGDSIFAVDPTIRKDEVRAIKDHFPDVRVIKRDRGHRFFPVESGVRVVQRGLRDALENTRIYFSRHLAPTPLGIVDSIQRYRRNEKTQEPIKDNLRDHPIDALRYLACELVPTELAEAVEYTT